MAEDVQTELERLRAEVESYRQRELESLRTQLAAVVAERDHYKAEAYRNADAGRQIHAELSGEISRLQSRIETQTQVARQLKSANATRN